MKYTSLESEYLVSLLKSALKGEATPSVPEGLDWAKLVELSKKQQVYSTIVPIINKINIPPEQAQELVFYSQNELVRMIAMKNELEEIEKELEKQGIRYMLLKGGVIRNYYPLQKMRQMSDFDLLYDEENRSKVMAIMKNRGYSIASNSENSDDFFKKPYYTFEWHRALFFEEHDFCPDFSDVWDNATQDEKKKCEYHMSASDLYLHSVAHMFKHYILGGFGIRFFADIYVLLTKLSNELDKKYIETKLSKMGLNEFEFNVRSVCYAIFDDKEITDEQIIFVNESLSFGVYGSGNSAGPKLYYEEYKAKHGEASVSKYYLSKIFPSKAYMKRTYPILQKKSYLLPIYYIVRLFDRFFHSRKRIKNDIKLLKESVKEENKNS